MTVYSPFQYFLAAVKKTAGRRGSSASRMAAAKLTDEGQWKFQDFLPDQYRKQKKNKNKNKNTYQGGLKS